MIIGIDFGQSNASAMCENDAEPILRKFGQFSYRLPPIVGIDRWDMYRAGHTKLVTELFWLKGAKTKNKDAILSLACDAYIAFGRITEQYGCRGFVLPVDVWKGSLFDGANKDKQVHSRLVSKLMLPNELALLPEGPRRWDALSAVGMAWAGFLLGPRLEGYQRA